MRLLNVRSNELESFFGKIPPYAILSHTWGPEEVTFDDIGTPGAIFKAGYQKILFTLRQAREDGYGYAWIDTCCIDKRSSAELSESINSMFRWYQEAGVCYAFLEDIKKGNEISSTKWLTRGWTLQELLAPKEVIFFDRQWIKIGTRRALSNTLAQTCGIDGRALVDDGDPTLPRSTLEYIQNASVAQRMSWVSWRKTTREEDISYCMLGIFNINMPLLYGEGSQKAFHRLQEEIVKSSTDQSILAWQIKQPKLESSQFQGVLAIHPVDFVDSSNIIRTGERSVRVQPFVMNNKGLQIQLPIFSTGLSRRKWIAILSCFAEDNLDHYIGLLLTSVDRDNLTFVREHDTLVRLGPRDLRKARLKDICILRVAPSGGRTGKTYLSIRPTPRIFGWHRRSGYLAYDLTGPGSFLELPPAHRKRRCAIVYDRDHTKEQDFNPNVDLYKLNSNETIVIIVDFTDGHRYSAFVSMHRTLRTKRMSNDEILELSTLNPPASWQRSCDLPLTQHSSLRSSISWQYVTGRTCLILDVSVVENSHRDIFHRLVNAFILGISAKNTYAGFLISILDYSSIFWRRKYEWLFYTFLSLVFIVPLLAVTYYFLQSWFRVEKVVLMPVDMLHYSDLIKFLLPFSVSLTYYCSHAIPQILHYNSDGEFFPDSASGFAPNNFMAAAAIFVIGLYGWLTVYRRYG